MKSRKSGKASVSPIRKEKEPIQQAVERHFAGVQVPAVVMEPWPDAQVEQTYTDFSVNLHNAYGAVLKFARAIVAGAVSDNQVRDLWTTKKEDDAARKFLAALKESLRTAQADAEGNLSKDAFTYNVNPKTKVLVREKIQTRENRKPNILKAAKRVARMFKDYEWTDTQKERAIRLFTDAVMNPQTILDADAQ